MRDRTRRDLPRKLARADVVQFVAVEVDVESSTLAGEKHFARLFRLENPSLVEHVDELGGDVTGLLLLDELREDSLHDVLRVRLRVRAFGDGVSAEVVPDEGEWVAVLRVRGVEHTQHLQLGGEVETIACDGGRCRV